MKDFAAPVKKIRRKRMADSEIDEPVKTTKIQATRDTTTSDILHMQGAMGNRAVQRMLTGQQTQTPQIQRLMTYKKYKKETSAWGARNHIKALDVAFKAYSRDQGNLNGNDKLTRLQALVTLCDAYLADPKRQQSKRRDGVEDLKQELLNEIAALKSDMTGDEFTDDNVTETRDKVVGGQMNKLDYVKYNFGVTQDVDDEGVAQDKKVAGGEFEGYFKQQTYNDQKLQHTRGQWTGINAQDPKYAERSVATYEIAKLLDPSIIPPTFLAKHSRDGQEVEGFVMKIVQGIGGDKQIEVEGEEDDRGNPLKRSAATMYQNDPVYRQSMSKLMLLDFICGQVDRHSGNYIIQLGKDGKVTGVVGIDNDLSFGENFTDLDYAKQARGVKGHMFNNFISAGGDVKDLNEIDKKFAERIVQLSQNTGKIRAVLGGLLSDGEVNAAVSRLTSLANFLRPLLNSNSPIIKSKWE